MGLLYERAAVEFWEGVVGGVRVDEAAGDSFSAKDGRDRIESTDGWPDGRREF